MMEIITGVLIAERDRTRDFIDALVDAEQNYHFTNDWDYITQHSDIVPPTEENQNQPQQVDSEGKPIP